MDRKTERIKGMQTEAIQRILSTLQAPENMEPSEAHPLGGIVHIEGIGQVSVDSLRKELASREEIPPVLGHSDHSTTPVYDG